MKTPFARDRLVEIYFFILAMYFEPQYSRARRILTKVHSIISTIDDMYDAYGTLEEHKLFAQVIQRYRICKLSTLILSTILKYLFLNLRPRGCFILRWDINSINQLPEFIKVIYQALLDVYKEIEEEMDKEGQACCFYYAKEAVGSF